MRQLRMQVRGMPSSDRAVSTGMGFLDSSTKEAKQGKEALGLSQLPHDPKEMAVVPCRGHQRGDSETLKGIHAECAALSVELTQRPLTPTLLSTQRK